MVQTFFVPTVELYLKLMSDVSTEPTAHTATQTTPQRSFRKFRRIGKKSFQKHWMKALRWARHTNLSDREEVAARGMLAALRDFDRKLGEFEPRLRWMVRSERSKFLRSEFRRLRRENCYADHAADTATGCAVGLAETERNKAVRDALRKLSRDQGRVVRQFYFKGQSYVKIARKEGVPESTLRNRAATARKKLAGLLKDLAPDRTQSAPSKPGKSRHKRAQPKRGTTTEPGIGLPQASLAHPSAKSK